MNLTPITFAVREAHVIRGGASPAVGLRLGFELDPTANFRVESMLLRVLTRIEPQKREHSPDEARALWELFGEPSRWSATVGSLVWHQTSLAVPGFETSGDALLELPCSYDFSLRWAKYLGALGNGKIPLHLFYSGTVFSRATDGPLRVSPLPADAETTFSLPVEHIRQALEDFFSGSVGLLLGRDLFLKLDRFRMEGGHASWDDAVDALLSAGGAS